MREPGLEYDDDEPIDWGEPSLGDDDEYVSCEDEFLDFDNEDVNNEDVNNEDVDSEDVPDRDEDDYAAAIDGREEDVLRKRYHARMHEEPAPPPDIYADWYAPEGPGHGNRLIYDPLFIIQPPTHGPDAQRCSKKYSHNTERALDRWGQLRGFHEQNVRDPARQLHKEEADKEWGHQYPAPFTHKSHGVPLPPMYAPGPMGTMCQEMAELHARLTRLERHL